MMTQLKISVVIPAYNAAKTVEAAVRSMLAQSLPPAEIIVVDDGSTDDTPRVLSSLGDAVRVVRQANGGLAAARTTGIREATGDLIAWLDADDEALPFRLEVQAAVMGAEPDVVLVASDFDAFGGESAETRGARRMYGALAEPGALERLLGPVKRVTVTGRDWMYHRGDARPGLLFGNFLHPPSVMMRREAVERVGPLNGSFAVSEDWLYFLDLSAIGHVAFVDEPLVRYRKSKGQMTSMARNGKNLALNNLHSFEFVLAQHPELRAARRAQVDHALAVRHLFVADTVAEREPWLAARHVGAAMRYGGPPGDVLKIVAKILLPGAVLRGIRRLRGRG